MNLNDLRKKQAIPSNPKYLPVQLIPHEPKFTGILSNNAVRITNDEEAQELHESGCFGVSNKFQKQFINQRYHELRDGLNEGDDNQSGVIYGKNDLDESLVLFPEEALFLQHSIKVLKIIDENGITISSAKFLKICLDQIPNFISKFVAYHYFRSKNWVVKKGTTFGSDFLLYKLGPQYFHSQYAVNVVDNDQTLMTKEFLGWHRILESSKKESLLVEVLLPTDMKNEQDILLDLSKCKVRVLSFKRFIYWKSKNGIKSTDVT